MFGLFSLFGYYHNVAMNICIISFGVDVCLCRHFWYIIPTKGINSVFKKYFRSTLVDIVKEIILDSLSKPDPIR